MVSSVNKVYQDGWLETVTILRYLDTIDLLSFFTKFGDSVVIECAIGSSILADATYSEVATVQHNGSLNLQNQALPVTPDGEEEAQCLRRVPDSNPLTLWLMAEIILTEHVNYSGINPPFPTFRGMSDHQWSPKDWFDVREKLRPESS